ncbi:hypothetical protein B0H14DRAFT_781278 [Mycena olivaceomarginata]|nr:hypothetical protein B0H14DRAFT_781278 [Mycena olivaceomarginata]
MDLDRELESGNPLQDPVRGSFLRRLVAAASRAVAPCATNDPNPDPDPVASQPEKWDREKGDYTDAENDEACAKIWSVYVGEAERYDKALVEGWKADMEGMLIFSGLFSASLTAFLIESYKILQPDSGHLTVAAITQVSHQLAAIASNTTFVLQSPPAFNPTTASLWCNALWFVSLSLSLTCALLATLVEQWAREFLHKTEIRPSPVRRARIFSFLYFGLKKFRMHTIVDVIPFLLHASLLLFFAGLIAFLLPVNYLMMNLMCIILATVLLLYLVLTVLPVIYLNCPYRTPLSAPLWSLLQNFSRSFNKPSLSSGQTITEAVVNSALQDTLSRDQQALKWTLDSLTDDTELLPFVEAIPDLVHGPNGFHHANDPLFDALLGTTEVASLLVTRIRNLIASTQGMPLKDPLRIRRCTAGQHAIWALCMMPLSWDRYFDIDIVFDASGGGLPPTTVLAVQYHAEKWFHHLLGMLYDLLTNHSHLSVYFLDEVLPTVRRLLQLVLENKNLIISPLSPSVSNVHLAHVAELKALYAEFANSKPTSPQLERTQLIIGVLYRSHDWAYHSVLLVGHFISKGILPDDEPLFEPMWTCSRILSAIESDPP